MVAKAQEAAPPWRAKIGRARRLLLPIGLLILGFVICLPTMGAKMFDPNEFSGNKLFQALAKLSGIDRRGILTVDVTGVFAPVLSGLPVPTLLAEMEQLGAPYPLSAPLPNSTSGISVEYDTVRRVPGNKFRPLDRIVVYFKVLDNDTIKITNATWVNTVAYP